MNYVSACIIILIIMPSEIKPVISFSRACLQRLARSHAQKSIRVICCFSRSTNVTFAVFILLIVIIMCLCLPFCCQVYFDLSAMFVAASL